MSAYVGDRTIDGLIVLLDGKPLSTYTNVTEYAAGGFEWGYEGDGPLQLAFAIAYSRVMDVHEARALAVPIMKKIVAKLENEWEIPVVLLDEFIADLKSGLV